MARNDDDGFFCVVTFGSGVTLEEARRSVAHALLELGERQLGERAPAARAAAALAALLADERGAQPHDGRVQLDDLGVKMTRHIRIGPLQPLM